ncbi:alanine racemase [Algoriphagus sp.]|jgi:D-serine deaminase-like pyridoxal phosphate-dependent protein|uniref:alanine racemase n=1 Tax=Algoriphagus sp. TaxID=1872435 RepID=UPI00271D2857|nr:alanine racemase [Algoriphagus sp.]MDO8967664.1 alanine racemase [Algoriphagus sp.]MDP3198360.1 alanine racemase [Algoriphagus sp.]
MSYLDQITSPTLLISEKITRANIKRMAEKAARNNKKLVPHWKTAQSHEIGNWAKEYGIKEVTASSIKLAEYLCGQGWDNIHIAFPFNPLEIPRLNFLAANQSLSVQLVNPITTRKLVEGLTNPVGFFIEIDAGYGRTGVHIADLGTIEKILRTATQSDKLKFKGFYLHPGHTYYTPDKAGIYEQSRQALHMLKMKYQSEFPDLVTRIGDTPGCAVTEDFGDIDELGPGNFVFFDLMQAELGSCTKEDIAVCLAVPVVDINFERKEILIHGGGVHLAKDVLVDASGNKNFGEVVYLNETGWTIPADRSYVKSISQEHGLINASDSLLQSVKVGDLLGVLPVHSCMTADCMGEYLSLGGKTIDHCEGKSL